MSKLETYYIIEMMVALGRYIEYCDHHGLVTTAGEMRKLRDWVQKSDIYLKPFNT